MRKNKKLIIIMIMLILCLFVLAIISMGLGKVNIFYTEDITIKKSILFNIRIPRIILAIASGCILAISGAVLQSLLGNPLADSYTLGISSGAALGACMTIYINIVFKKNIPIQINAMLFSVIVLVIVMKISSVRGIVTVTNLILSGIIVSAICQAGISFFKSMADENASTMINWLMGNISSKDIKQVILISITALVGLLICIKYSGELNIMALGRKEALLVGVNYDFLNKFLVAVCAIITAICVSLCGIIGFVGLVVPHLARSIVGADNRKVIPVSAVIGALLLLSADTFTRVILKHELPVGVITTLIGGPFFCFIFVKRREGM